MQIMSVWTTGRPHSADRSARDDYDDAHEHVPEIIDRAAKLVAVMPASELCFRFAELRACSTNPDRSAHAAGDSNLNDFAPRSQKVTDSSSSFDMTLSCTKPLGPRSRRASIRHDRSHLRA
jgi:hypothetical protein